MLTNSEIQSRTLLDNPLVAFQLAAEGGDDGHQDDDGLVWITQRIFIDDDEAWNWIKPQPHHYAPDQQNKTWRFYALPCNGSLARVVKRARDREEKGDFLDWQELGGEHFATLAGEPGRTMFLIRSHSAAPADYQLLGAFVPDADESKTYEHVAAAKAAALIYLHEFMTSH